VNWADFAILDEAGFTLHEKRALITLAMHAVADAATLCREGGIPTSKIYRALEKLEALELVEIQRTRPKLYCALPSEVVVDRLAQIAQHRAAEFTRRAQPLREILANLPGRLRGRQPYVDLALGTESHVKRHLARLAMSRRRILSYMEESDLDAVDEVAQEGFDVLKRIGRNCSARRVDHRIVFGFSDRTAPRLLKFLHRHSESIRNASGVRYSGELGHQFHVMDEETVLLSLDHPFASERRFASLLVRDKALADSLTAGFEALWRRALKDLREVRLLPRRDSARPQPT
jgi:HTH-type transcriptional regulator, sugar sensing transcriptional regulator